jgi:hypothetical protein
VKFGGVGELHAAFLTESRTRGRVRCSVQEIRVARLIRPTYAEANVGHPSSSYWVRLGGRLLPREVLTHPLKPIPFKGQSPYPSLPEGRSLHGLKAAPFRKHEFFSQAGAHEALALPALNPDFLYAALDATAYAAFVKESRKKRAGATKLHRKSGEARDQSRDSFTEH